MSQTGIKTIDGANYVVSAAMASSPAWLPLLNDISTMAATVAPILGVIWLMVQIVSKLDEWLRKK